MFHQDAEKRQMGLRMGSLLTFGVLLVTGFCGKEAANPTFELVGEFEKGPSRYLLQHTKFTPSQQNNMIVHTELEISISALQTIAMLFVIWALGGGAITLLFFFGKDYGIAKGYSIMTAIMALAAVFWLLTTFGYIKIVP